MWFLFFEGLWLEKIKIKTSDSYLVFACQNKKEQNENQKTHPLRLNQKVSSEFWYFGFWFWGFGVIVILYILQAFRYTKITNRVNIIYVCVLYVYIYMYVCLEGHDTRGFEVDLRRGTMYIYIYVDIDAYADILHHTVFQNGLAGLQITSFFPIFSGAVWVPRSSMCHPTNISFSNR